MEKILKEILNEIKTMKSQFNNLEVAVNGTNSRIDNLEVTVNRTNSRIDILEVTVNGMKEEHGLMLRAILEGKEVQRGEIDAITHRTAKIEGTIKGAAKQLLNDLQEASNQ